MQQTVVMKLGGPKRGLIPSLNRLKKGFLLLSFLFEASYINFQDCSGGWICVCRNDSLWWSAIFVYVDTVRAFQSVRKLGRSNLPVCFRCSENIFPRVSKHRKRFVLSFVTLCAFSQQQNDKLKHMNCKLIFVSRRGRAGSIRTNGDNQFFLGGGMFGFFSF